MPWAPALFEVSGDDDSSLEPVVYHARLTDLTVRQRTYVINGVNLYLATYTVVNDTDRVLPLVEVAMFADFDIPPVSHDLDTQFEPITQTVLVHDVQPYEDPEIHWYFGVSPAYPLVPTPDDFVFANFNLDDQLSLTQAASSSEENRLEFFLWHPDMIGDQDEADGKSEKQGAVSLVLPGPLMPGESREVAFCFGAADSESDEEAMTTVVLGLEACRAAYNVLHPNCGDSIVQFGEECDDGDRDSGDGCSADCQAEVCGDAEVTGDEACDDGNEEEGDGCGPSCQVEICGDGIVQATRGEECDDGNASSADDCLPDCVAARCGDGIVRGCAPGSESCGCAGYEFCWTGRLTITDYPDDVMSVPNTGAFDGLVDQHVEYLIAFDVASWDVPSRNEATFTTGPVHVEMQGTPEASSVIAPSLEGAIWTVTLGEDMDRYINSEPLRESRLSFYSLELDASGWTLDWAEDARGYPDLRTLFFPEDEGRATLRRYEVVPIPRMTDEATGVAYGHVTPGTAPGAGEACDDGNSSDYDLCTSTCVPASCGDGFLQPDNGEECDEGPAPPAWCAACLIDREAGACPNGTIEDLLGEECDDNNTVDGDGCSALCVVEFCGDGVVQAGLGEECDDGPNGDGDGCSSACVVERCGDGIVQNLLGEECDTGATVSDSGECLTSCRPAACPDGFVREGVEECDDGNAVDGDGCNAGCVIEVCGDAAAGPGEECDDGNETDADGCSTDCRLEYCGDSRPGPGEQCDDGNTVDRDGCSKDCQLENPAACGDGRLQTGEQCDDGNAAAGDGCGPFCQLEAIERCGDGTVDPGEGCDDGNVLPGDGCSAFCAAEACGDGLHQQGEECDDGDEESGDGCTPECRAEPATCGNGVHEYGEQCDDGNLDEGDGCTAACAADPVDRAALRETCGDGAFDVYEECDDGGRADGDGCDETCQLEAAVCGNAHLDHGETCDDGNDAPADGCGSTCRLELCGNGTVDEGEECDDGNAIDLDGCSSLCEDELCGNGTVDEGEECDDGNAIDLDGCSSLCEDELCGDGILQEGEDCDLGVDNGGPFCTEDCTLPGPDCDCAAPGRARDGALELFLLLGGVLLALRRLQAGGRRL
jgi:cysteine-rich repeat protein